MRRASSRASRPSLPDTGGGVRPATARTKERISSSSGSTAWISTGFSVISICPSAPFRRLRETSSRLLKSTAWYPSSAEEPDLLHDLSRDPARGDVRHTAARKGQAGVGDVHLVRENRNPDGVHGRNRGADEMEDDVEVVDHQIEDDVHVRAAFEEGVEAVGFDEEGRSHHGPEGRDGRIEPLDEADLEDQPLCPGEGDQFIRLGKRRGDRFFQQDVHARLQKDRGDLMVGAGRHGDRDGVDLSQKSAVVRQNLAVAAVGRLPGILLHHVGDADDPAFRNFPVFLEVVAAQMAGSHHADSDPVHHIPDHAFRRLTADPSFRFPDEIEELPDLGQVLHLLFDLPDGGGEEQ